MNLVSVIIPVYNHEFLVRECVESVLNQTYKNIEIILVNDFSTDNTSKVCRTIEQEYKNVHFVEQKMNQGPLAARVRGIRESIGDYIVFCDADDMLPENCVESLMKGFELLQTDMVLGNFAQKYEEKIVDNKSRLSVGVHKCCDLLKKQIDDGSMSGILISSQCGKLYSRKIVEQFLDSLPQSLRINEDGIFNTNYLLHSLTVGVISDRVYIERSRKRTSKKQVNLELFKAADEALMQLRAQWPDKNSFDKQMKRRKVSTTFILSFWICNHCNFINARKHLKKLWNELKFKNTCAVIREDRMRIYKRTFYHLMKHKCYLLFYAGIRISPLLRKYIAR